MKNSLFKRILRRLKYFFSITVGWMLPIKNNRILMWSYSANQFSCNPAYFTRFLLKYKPGEYEIYWLFNEGVSLDMLPAGISVVKYGSFRHIFIINTAKYVFSNARVGDIWALWKKKKGQRYIMTYHAGFGIKKVEQDADKQYLSYLRVAKEDSDRCDLMLSGSSFWTSVMRRSFQYDGEILEFGTPRNDLFFYGKNDANTIRQTINRIYNIPENARILLYAPTFRNDGLLSHYQLDWNELVKTFGERFGGEFIVLLRLHPDMINHNKTAVAIFGNNSLLRNVTLYHDIQELLLMSDILLTDYSSSMFDMTLTKRPVFLYADDSQEYNRGTYFPLNELPFPFASTEDELYSNVKHFNECEYIDRVDEFVTNIIGSFEKGEASKALYGWVKSH